jgi:hypothetical protein
MLKITGKEWGVATAITAAIVTIAAFIFIIFYSPAKAHYFPDPGVYTLPDSERSQVAPEVTGSLDVTISGERLNRFELSDLSIGATGIGTVFEISASTGSIIVDVMTADGLVCPTFTFADSEVFSATYENNRADGNDFSFTGGSPSDVTIESVRGAKSRTASNESYDKLKLTATSDVLISELVITDVKAFGGGCVFSDMEIGTLYVTNSIIGTGDGIGVKEFGFGSGVTIGNFTSTNNVEEEIHVR